MTRRSAFTLIELIVAIVLMAVLSGVLLPRFLDSPARSATIEARALAGTLEAAVRRATSSSGAVRLRVSPERDALLVERRDASADAGWRTEPLIPPARLTWLRISGVREGGFEIKPAGWALALGGGQPRPDLAFVLQRVGGDGSPVENEREFVVSLSALQRGALVAREGDESAPSAAVVDLDLTGRGSDAW